MAKVVVFNATPNEINVSGYDHGLFGNVDWNFNVDPWGSAYHDNGIVELTFHVKNSGDRNINPADSWVYVYSESGLSSAYNLLSPDPGQIVNEAKYEYENRFVFFVDSDIHYGGGTSDPNQHANKMKNKDYMLNAIAEDQKQTKHRIKAVLLCGDYIDNLNDKTAISDFKEDYVQKFTCLKPPVPVLCGLGNHDVYGFNQITGNSFLDFTRDTLKQENKNIIWGGVGYINPKLENVPAGGFYSTFFINNTLFFSCGIYPNSIGKIGLSCIADFVKNDVRFDPAKENRTPVFFFFHYNIFGKFSDWWSDEEKEEFYCIAEQLNVQGIFCGHFHISKAYEWKDKKIPVYQVGGKAFAKVTVQPKIKYDGKPNISTSSVELITP